MRAWATVFPIVYDWIMALVECIALARWRRSVVRPARGFVLEIGAGTGLDFPYYTTNATVVATDLNVAMLRRGWERVVAADATILLVAADAEALPFRSASFDGAVVALAMCTIPHPKRALVELRRVARPGASVALLEHVRVHNAVIGRLQDWLTPLWRRLAGGCRLDRDTVRTVAESGLLVEEVTPHAGGSVVEVAARVPSGLAVTERAERRLSAPAVLSGTGAALLRPSRDCWP